MVVNYGSAALLEQNLMAVPSEQFQIVVVDSFSDPAERTRMQALASRARWQLVEPADNVGFGVGSNLGAQRALQSGARVLIFVNPDARIDEDACHRLAACAADDATSIIAPRIVRPDGSTWSSGTTDLFLNDGTMRATAKRSAAVSDSERPVVTWLSGACLAMSADLWTRLGGFDPDYFLYWEDVDLSWRAHEAGARLHVLEDVAVVHDEGATHAAARQSSRAKSGTYYYYNIRNRMLFATKHLGASDRRAWRRSSLAAARAIVLQGGRRQLLTGLTPWIAAARGVRDGLRLSR